MGRNDPRKKAARPDGPAPKNGDDAAFGPAVSSADKKVLDKFLHEVEEGSWGVSDEDKEKALKDLRAHILERYRPHQTEQAMDVAVSAVGSPDVLAKGIRTLYGYSTGFKSFLLIIIILMGLTTVPLAQAWTAIGPWPILGLLVTFLLISTFGTQTGLLWGALMGLGAATARVVLLVVLVFSMPNEYTVGTTTAFIDFVLVSMFMMLVGVLAGHIRESTVKDYFREETV